MNDITRKWVRIAAWFFARAFIFIGMCILFLFGSTWVVAQYDDIGATYWGFFSTLYLASVIPLWIVLDIVCIIRGFSVQQLWKCLGVSVLVFIVLSPPWIMGLSALPGILRQWR